MRKIIIFAMLGLVLAACTTNNPGNNVNQPGTHTSLDDGLKKFDNTQDLMNYLDSVSASEQYYGGATVGVRNFAAMDMTESASSAKAASAPQATGGSASADDYSQTNVQVEGVDEADFVKNDGKYIYVLSGTNFVIVDAYPADKADILSQTEIDGNPKDLFINGDKAVIMSQENEYVNVFPEFGIVPVPRYTQKTTLYVYDISDKKNPSLEKKFDVSGYYLQSRMIGDYVYLISQDNVYYYNHIVDTPVIRSGSVSIRPDIYYFDNPEYSYNFNTVMSLDLNNLDVDAQSFMMGYADTIYVSQDNIYIAYQKSFMWNYEQDNEERFYSVVVPLLPTEVKGQINDIKNTDMSKYEKWDKISAVLEDMYNSMDENDKDKLVGKLQDAVNEYEIKQQQERRKTVINKISIKDGKLDYKTRGEVPGYLLNQFSMDENDGNLRVATTMQAWVDGENILYNNVYVLDDNLKTIGELEDIAPDESIYATRFMGDRLYMVTYKQVDPFFVIDLSNAKNPKVLGALKVPGFSQYLEPYDETHIIGIGKETTANEWGGVTTEGVKIALFDVSDFENPRVVDSYEIGDTGSDSEALRDHKALLFDKEKNLLVLPVREVKGRYKDPRYGYYRYMNWQGAYVFHIDANNIDLEGKITHMDDEYGDLYYYWSENTVRRALFMDDTLYTVSMGKIMMNDLADNLAKINEVDLPYEAYSPTPIYYDVGGPVAVDTVMVK